MEATKCDDLGNPLRLFLFSDGMTQYTCQTPKFAQISKGDKVIETRIVGTEVVCGPIRTVLVYRTDELVSGGANITIEMTRQALIDVSILLLAYFGFSSITAEIIRTRNSSHITVF